LKETLWNLKTKTLTQKQALTVLYTWHKMTRENYHKNKF